MTTEEKSKAYDEALKVLHKYDGANIMFTQSLKEEMFPELKESEDERVRKALINGFNKLDKSAVWYNGITNAQILAWLENQELKSNPYSGEKQSSKSTDDLTPQEAMDIAVAKCFEQDEQKPADKVNPKFRNGQWIVWQDKCYKVNYNGCGYELVDQKGLSTSLEYGTIDENAHIWDITKDAKDGDVLVAENGWTCIFKELKGENFSSFCFMDSGCYFHEGSECHTTDERICGKMYPATKEQRDTLMKAMANAGYTFDFEKKELKKIEQKYWNEEDERMFDYALDMIEWYNGKNEDKSRLVSSWLKSIKDRVQPKQEWNEKDEKFINNVEESLLAYKIIVMDNDTELANYIEKEIDWLKSLRPQKQWKPNDRQIKALKEACDEHWEPDGLDSLYVLWEQLKKLREE